MGGGLAKHYFLDLFGFVMRPQAHRRLFRWVLRDWIGLEVKKVSAQKMMQNASLHLFLGRVFWSLF